MRPLLDLLFVTWCVVATAAVLPFILAIELVRWAIWGRS